MKICCLAKLGLHIRGSKMATTVLYNNYISYMYLADSKINALVYF